MIVLIATTLLLLVHHGQCSQSATATVHIDSNTTSIGTVSFFQQDAGSLVAITINLTNLTASTTHGFHVHEFGLPNGVYNCTAAGAHFNPYNTTHGPETADILHRHVGDLGNLTTDSNGNIQFNMNDGIIDLYNATRLITGLTIVLHAMPDDGGMGNFSDSHTTGHAGARIACGVINMNSRVSPVKSMMFAIMAPVFFFVFFRQ